MNNDRTDYDDDGYDHNFNQNYNYNDYITNNNTFSISVPDSTSPSLQKLRRRAMASWVRESILQLGPTFIKLGGCLPLGTLWHSPLGPQGVSCVSLPLVAGQLSSTRSDLLPAEFTEELSKLQVGLGAGGWVSDHAIAAPLCLRRRGGCWNRFPHLTS